MDFRDKTFLRGVAVGGAAAIATAVLYGLTCSSSKPSSPASPDSSKPSKQTKAPSTAVVGTASTTNSGLVADASAGNVYETQKAVSEYIMFHYGAPADVLPYADGPVSALNFPQRTADICARVCREKGVPMTRALDIGCAVGAASFHLATHFTEVVGIDFSNAFVAAANEIKATGVASYDCVVEAEISKKKTAEVPAAIDRSRCSFEQGDACNMRAGLGKFSVIHGSNLLCRLPEPTKFLQRLDSLLVDGGIVVLVSPYSWMPGYTSRDKWVGGFVEDSKPHYSRKGLLEIMEDRFKLVEEADTPFLIREHARKFQWGCSHTTIWQKR